MWRVLVSSGISGRTLDARPRNANLLLGNLSALLVVGFGRQSGVERAGISRQRPQGAGHVDGAAVEVDRGGIKVHATPGGQLHVPHGLDRHVPGAPQFHGIGIFVDEQVIATDARETQLLGGIVQGQAAARRGAQVDAVVEI